MLAKNPEALLSVIKKSKINYLLGDIVLYEETNNINCSANIADQKINEITG